jgi:hypothetical protein
MNVAMETSTISTTHWENIIINIFRKCTIALNIRGTIGLQGQQKR